MYLNPTVAIKAFRMIGYDGSTSTVNKSGSTGQRRGPRVRVFGNARIFLNKTASFTSAYKRLKNLIFFHSSIFLLSLPAELLPPLRFPATGFPVDCRLSPLTASGRRAFSMKIEPRGSPYLPLPFFLNTFPRNNFYARRSRF